MSDHKCDDTLQRKDSTITENILILFAVWLCAAFIRRKVPNTNWIIPGAVIVSAIIVFSGRFTTRTRKVLETCFRYRWVIALVVFLLCLVFRLHGSSIGVYDDILPTKIDEVKSIMFGMARPIRSDEYGVATMKYFSQAANGYRLYSRQMSLSPTNMVIDYYSPVWDWTILGKPLSWGFLLFGNEIGLSWYWCGEIILLFMTAFEMCLILTGWNRRISALGAVMIVLSPAIQWWVMPHMPLVILYSMALFCLGYWFFTAKTQLSGWSSAVLAVIGTTGFALSIFPSFQVPCAYIVLVLLFVCLRRDHKQITFRQTDWLRLALPVFAVLMILGQFILHSREELRLLLNTEYPGPRMCLGGNASVSELFTNLTSFFLPYRDPTFSNNCEVSSYIQFAPLFFVLSPYLLLVLRKEKSPAWGTGLAFVCILLVQIIYMLIGFPEWLARITLFRFCNRMSGVYGWTATLFTIWGMNILDSYPTMLNRWAKILLPILFGIVSTLLLGVNELEYFAQFFSYSRFRGLLLIVGAISLMIGILYFVLFQRRRLLSASLLLAMFFCGATVNPIAHGIGAVTNHPISVAISNIVSEEPDSRWLCTDSNFMMPNYLLAHGAVVLDSALFYPDIEKWKILDPENKYKKLTNRYAHERAELTRDETSVELLHPDSIKLYLNPASVKMLDIHYLFTPVDHTSLLAEYGISCTYVTGQDGYGIYRLDYHD